MTEGRECRQIRRAQPAAVRQSAAGDAKKAQHARPEIAELPDWDLLPPRGVVRRQGHE